MLILITGSNETNRALFPALFAKTDLQPGFKFLKTSALDLPFGEITKEQTAVFFNRLKGVLEDPRVQNTEPNQEHIILGFGFYEIFKLLRRSDFKEKSKISKFLKNLDISDNVIVVAVPNVLEETRLRGADRKILTAFYEKRGLHLEDFLLDFKVEDFEKIPYEFLNFLDQFISLEAEFIE